MRDAQPPARSCGILWLASTWRLGGCQWDAMQVIRALILSFLSCLFTRPQAISSSTYLVVVVVGRVASRVQDNFGGSNIINTSSIAIKLLKYRESLCFYRSRRKSVIVMISVLAPPSRPRDRTNRFPLPSPAISASINLLA